MTRQASPALTPHTITPPLRGSRGAKGLPTGEPVGGQGNESRAPACHPVCILLEVPPMCYRESS